MLLEITAKEVFGNSAICGNQNQIATKPESIPRSVFENALDSGKCLREFKGFDYEVFAHAVPGNENFLHWYVAVHNGQSHFFQFIESKWCSIFLIATIAEDQLLADLAAKAI